MFGSLGCHTPSDIWCFSLFSATEAEFHRRGKLLLGELNLLTVLKAGKSESMVLASGEGLGDAA